MSLPKPIPATNGSASSTSVVRADTLLKPYSEVWEFLTACQYPDGTKRQTGRLSLSWNGHAWAIALTDPTTGLFAFIEGTSPDDVLLTIDTMMGEDRVPWRSSKYPSKKR